MVPRLLSAIFAALALMLLPVAMGGAGQAMAHGTMAHGTMASAPAGSAPCHGEAPADDDGGSMKTACANACAGFAAALPQVAQATINLQVAAAALPSPRLFGVHLPTATPPPRFAPETLL